MEALTRASTSHASMLRPHRALALALLTLLPSAGGWAPTCLAAPKFPRARPAVCQYYENPQFSQPQYGGYDQQYDSASPYNIQDGRVRLARGPVSELSAEQRAYRRDGGYAQSRAPYTPQPKPSSAEERAWLRGEDQYRQRAPQLPLERPQSAEERSWMRGDDQYRQRAPYEPPPQAHSAEESVTSLRS